MILGEVIGSVTATIKHEAYKGHRLLLVQPIEPSGAHSGKEFIAIDNAQAGPGDRVVVLKEGNGVRQVLGVGEEACPILETVVGVVDRLEVG